MSEEYQDPSANTAQFQAFANRAPEEPTKRTRPVGLLIGVAAIAIVVAIVVVYLVVA